MCEERKTIKLVFDHPKELKQWQIDRICDDSIYLIEVRYSHARNAIYNKGEQTHNDKCILSFSPERWRNSQIALFWVFFVLLVD